MFFTKDATSAFLCDVSSSPGGCGAVWAVWTGSEEPPEINRRSPPHHSGPACFHQQHTGTSGSDTPPRGDTQFLSLCLSFICLSLFSIIIIWFIICIIKIIYVFGHLNITHIVEYPKWALICCFTSPSEKAFNKILEAGCKNLLPFSQKSITEVKYRAVKFSHGPGFVHGNIVILKQEKAFPKLSPQICKYTSV